MMKTPLCKSECFEEIGRHLDIKLDRVYGLLITNLVMLVQTNLFGMDLIWVYPCSWCTIAYPFTHQPIC